MAACARCGSENPPGAKFCNECAAPLGEPATREQRKVVNEDDALRAVRAALDIRRRRGRSFERALRLYEARGNVVLTGRTRGRPAAQPVS